ncbi:MAG: FAD-binding oxidoreductase [Deltaproteobacteria bacterium]|nr:FAD-binding oxidoreductase [Deltaproteobacteria bacterium]
MIDAAALDELRAVAGEAAVLEHDPMGLDGARLELTIAPTSVEDLAATLGVCASRRLPLLVRGGGSRLGLGNRPRGARAWLSTAALEPVCEVDGDEGVARVGAATPAADLDAAARGAGWRSPFETSNPLSTVGGVLATAASGPRSLGLGPARRAALGLEVALASGDRTRCGSRVVKNVTGYDLVKLYVGSLGTLGVLTEAWLRLRPKPEAERAFAGRVGHEGLALAREAARRSGARAVAIVDGTLASAISEEGEGDLLIVEFAGDEPVVDEAEAWLRTRAGELAEAPDAVGRLHGLQESPSTAALRFRISAPTPHLEAAHSMLRERGAGVITHPGLSQTLAFFDLESADTTGVDAAWRAVHAAVDPTVGAHAILEQAPGWAKDGRDVFDAPAATLPLMRTLKSEFDPAGVLNPGRFVGAL